jgi:hypothetical protein
MKYRRATPISFATKAYSVLREDRASINHEWATIVGLAETKKAAWPRAQRHSFRIFTSEISDSGRHL